MNTSNSPSVTKNHISRRAFIGSAAAATAGLLIVPRHVLGGPDHTSPNSKLNIAAVGIGGQGGWDLGQLGNENIVALCDVDSSYAAGTFAKYPKAKRYKDYRVMLEKEKNIDAVVVATPDHLHAAVSMAAIKMGKHVYCEKPLTHTVYEARMLAEAARAAKVVTQMGNQGMAYEGNCRINEWIWAGLIGPVREVHVWSDRPTNRGKRPLWWEQGMERPSDEPPVPEGLDWDLWLGPAPWRPYHPAYVPFRWRGWWDFGSGGMGDMGIHNFAPIFSALKLGAPESIQSSSTPSFEETVPAASTVHYQFPARGDMPPVKVHWYDGGLHPEWPEELNQNGRLDPEDGIIFVGDKGKILVTGWGGENPHLLPESRYKDIALPPKSLPRSIGHHKEWIEACKGNGTTRSNFDFAGPLTEAVLLGALCIRNGGDKITWDAKEMKIANDPDANQFVKYDYREGWTL